MRGWLVRIHGPFGTVRHRHTDALVVAMRPVEVFGLLPVTGVAHVIEIVFRAELQHGGVVGAESVPHVGPAFRERDIDKLVGTERVVRDGVCDFRVGDPGIVAESPRPTGAVEMAFAKFVANHRAAPDDEPGVFEFRRHGNRLEHRRQIEVSIGGGWRDRIGCLIRCLAFPPDIGVEMQRKQADEN